MLYSANLPTCRLRIYRSKYIISFSWYDSSRYAKSCRQFCAECLVLMSGVTMQQRGEIVSANRCRKAENNESTKPLLHTSSALCLTSTHCTWAKRSTVLLVKVNPNASCYFHCGNSQINRINKRSIPVQYKILSLFKVL